MYRFLQKDLVFWKQNQHRKPLLLRGARQVGKTHAIRDFAKENFDHLVEVNFELQPNYKKIFTTLEPAEIVRNLNLALGKTIKPGVTLLFLDEIQECPQAISALRYFYEKMPHLHVIGAGSLLEFALSTQNFKMPVGRVEYLYMQPMTFEEFLLAAKEEGLKSFLDALTLRQKINEAVQARLFQLFKKYLLVGGMPEAIQVYLGNPDSNEFQDVQLSLLQTYRDDFGKYASRAKHVHLHKVFNTAPSKVGQIYKYSHIDRETPSKELKTALHLLVQAGVMTQLHATSGHGLPFIKDVNERKFKILFLDVGLMQRACGLDAQIALADDFLAVNSGAVAEQFVGQQLLSLRNPHEKNSKAEVDFLTVIGSKILPVEVKAGKTGTLKSLKLFLQEHNSPLGIRFSQQELSFHDKILSIPIYAVSQMPKITKSLVKIFFGIATLKEWLIK